MKYTWAVDGEEVRVWGFGILLTDDEARRLIRHGMAYYGIREAPPHEQETHDRRPTVIGR